MRRLVSFIIMLILAKSLLSQAPQKISYQAVIRNSSNMLVTSSAVGVQVSILQGSISGIEVFKETYNPNPQTNVNGLVTIEIGSGIALSGSFTSINWATGPFFIKTEIDPLGGTAYTITGVSELLSVPYALFAKTAENISSGITETDPVFTNHVANGISSTNINDWNSAYSWGNHTGLYSLTGHSHPYLQLIGGEMSNTNVVTNLNADLLDGQEGSYFAPSFGSANYVQVNPTSVQLGNIWMGGSVKSQSIIHPTSGIQFTTSVSEHNFNGTVDRNLSIGYNLMPNTPATRIDNSEPQIKWDLESDWNDSGTHYMEANVNYQGIDGTVRRPFGIFINRDTHDIKWILRSGAQQTMIFSDNGFVSIGGETSPIGILDIAGTRSTSGYGYGVLNRSSITSTVTDAYGFSNSPTITPANNKWGINFNSSGTIKGTSGQTKNAASIYISPMEKSGSFTVNNAYGIYLSTPNIGTNNYSIWAGGKSKIGDNIGIGVIPVSGSALKVGGSITDANYVFGMEFSPSLTSIESHVYGLYVNPSATVSNIFKSVISVQAGVGTLNVTGGENSFYNVYAPEITTLYGSLKNHYGLYIANLTKAENNWSIYTGSAPSYFGSSVDAISYKLSGVSTLLDWTRIGYAGTAGQIPISQGNSTTPVWKSLADAGIASASVYPASGLTNGFIPYKTSTVLVNSPIYTNGTNVGIGTTSPTAALEVYTPGTTNLKVEGGYSQLLLKTINDANYSTLSFLNVAGATVGFIKYDFSNKAMSFRINGSESIRILANGNFGIGYTTGIQIDNNKLAVNGSIFANGVMTATGGISTNWNTAYNWGNHAGLYRSISYVPAWNEITSNPFSFSSVSNNQLLKYNSTTLKWENWTPNFLTSFVEADPSFTVWNKSSGISIIASQISDFQTSVTNNAAVLTNTAKNSYPTIDSIKLAGIATRAEVNVNADWNATSGDAQILNKPTIPPGTNQGDMQYWNGAAWLVVQAGQPGQFLQFTASNIPEWTTVLPILTTTEISALTNNSATSGGNIVSSGGGTITTRGVCWSTYPNPTLLDNKTSDGTETGIFTSLMTGLSSATTYYVRAYATNNSYTAYGNQESFTTVP